MLINVDYHLTDVCNLNCAHCNHFCPLVPKDTKHKSLEQITADLSLLSKFKNDLDTLGLLGGEPTLHPQLSDICYISRKFFPNNHISITSNGTRANNMLQWKDAIEKNDIDFVVTIYPYKENPYEDYEKIAKVIPNNVSIWEFPTTNGMTYNELTSRNDIVTPEEIKNCYKRIRCNQLLNGKLYICHYTAYFNYLKNAFPDKINVKDVEGSYIDLNNDNLTIEDIYEFQRTAWPILCDHCLDAHYNNYYGPTEPWRKSELDINEWWQTNQ